MRAKRRGNIVEKKACIWFAGLICSLISLEGACVAEKEEASVSSPPNKDSSQTQRLSPAVETQPKVATCDPKDTYKDLGIKIPRGGVSKTHPSKRVERWLDKGNAALGKENEKKAEAYFRKALRGNHFFPEAHLALGKLLLDQGKIEQGAEQYLALMKRDYPTYREYGERPGVWVTEKIFQSPYKEVYLKKVSQIERRWKCALQTGIPLVWWEEYSEKEMIEEDLIDDPYYYTGPKVLRPGVYFPQSKLFLPVGKPEQWPLAAWYFQSLDRTVFIKAYGKKEYISTLEYLESFIEDGFGKNQAPPAKKIEEITSRKTKEVIGPYICSVILREHAGALKTKVKVNVSDSRYDCQFGDWLLLTQKPEIDSEQTRGNNQLHILSEGSIWIHHEEGHTLDGRVLTFPSGKQTKLSWGNRRGEFRSVLKLGKQTWVVSTEHSCGEPLPGEVENYTFAKHKTLYSSFIDRVDPSAQASLVHKGHGSASVFKVSATLALIQLGHRLYSLDQKTKDLSDLHPFPEGLVIHLPLLPPNCQKDHSAWDWE